MTLGALLPWVYGLALKPLLGHVGVACGNRDCADGRTGMEGERGLDTSLYLQSMDTVTDTATQLQTCLIAAYFGCRFKQ